MVGLLAVGGATASWGQTTYFLDDFNGTDGADVAIRTPTVGSYALVGTNNTTNLQIQNGALNIRNLSSADDVAAVFDGGVSVTNSTIFLGFDLTVSSATTADGYFLAFRQSGTTYPSRLFLDNTGSGTFTLGLGTGASPSVSWSSNLNAGVTYRIIFSYNEGASDSSALWINPVSLSSTSISMSATATGIGSVLLRQDNSFSSGLLVDNMIATSLFTAAIPEPSSFAALAGLGMLGFYATRRRR